MELEGRDCDIWIKKNDQEKKIMFGMKFILVNWLMRLEMISR